MAEAIEKKEDTPIEDISKIKASGSAIVYETKDFETKFEYSLTAKEEAEEHIKKYISENGVDEKQIDYISNGSEQSVTLYDTVLETTSETESLIKVNASKTDTDTAKVSNAKFYLSGVKSSAESADKGWLIEVKSVDGAASELDVTIDDYAYISGLTNKETSDDGSSATLNVSLNNGAVWELKQKTDLTDGQRSTLNNLTINDGVLGIKDGAEGVKYFIKLTSDGKNNDGVLTNNGTIALSNTTKNYEDQLTIEGNYIGGTNSVVILDTLWNKPADDDSEYEFKSDKLVITGTATGRTTVKASDSKTGNNIIDGDVETVNAVINSDAVITVEKTGDIAFIGTTKTTGISEVQLAKRTNEEGQDEYYWTTENIIDPVVPAYVNTSKVNIEQSLMTLGTYDERRGNAVYSDGLYKKDQQTWTRIFTNNLKENGKSRFNTKSNVWGIQVGHDFFINETANGRTNQAGVYLAYNKSNNKYYDEYKAINGIIGLDKFAGKVDSEVVSLGASYTLYKENDNYLDLVTQLSYINNHYKPIEGTTPKQKGLAWALSGEYGKSYILSETANGSSFVVEPQAQLVYQFTKLDGFNDIIKEVGDNEQHTLRGRIGSKISYVTEGNNTVYGIANIWHDFTGTRDISIGKDNIKEKFARTWGEFGLGSVLKTSARSNVFIDGRYQKEFGKGERKGFRANVGFNYSW